MISDICLLVNWEGYYVLFNATSMTSIVSGDFSDTYNINYGELANTSHFVLSSWSGVIFFMDASNNIVWQ